jgi:hypothetical protein
MEDDYNWDEDDEDVSGGRSAWDKDADLPTIDSKSGRVVKPRKSGSPFEWLLGVKSSGFTPGQQQTVAKKYKKGKKFESELEEKEYPEEEQYDEEIAGDEEWDDDQSEARYAPISTKITITKVDLPPMILWGKQ